MSSSRAGQIIRQLNLERHPEGGWYRETYRAAGMIRSDALPERFTGDRSFCTAIYYLLEQGDKSMLHRIKSDELWHFYAGAPLAIHVIGEDGTYRMLKLGTDLTAGETYQAMVPAGCWFGAEISGSGHYTLVGCTVSPGFDFADFEMGVTSELLKICPGHAELIRRLAKTPR